MSDNITLPREVVEEAAESLEWADSQVGGDDCYEDAAKALRTALAAPSEDIEALRRDAELGRWIREETPPIEEIAARVDAMEDKT